MQLSAASEVINMYKAESLFCLPAYVQYKKARKEAMRELQLETTDDGSLLVGSNVTSCK